jgi:Family of unknown function (DUF6368)
MNDFIRNIHADEVNYVKSIKCEDYEIHYEIETVGRTSFYHICNAEWLQHWLQHDDFHLIK